MEIIKKIENNREIYIFKCNECNGTFWTKNAYLNHWSCNKKIKCSHCFDEGHVVTNCHFIVKSDNKDNKQKIKKNKSFFEIDKSNNDNFDDFVAIDIESIPNLELS